MWLLAKWTFAFGAVLCLAGAAFADSIPTSGGTLTFENLRWALLFLGGGLAWGDFRSTLKDHERRLDKLENNRRKA